MTARFGRVIPAMVTPFGDDGSFDPDDAVTLARWLVDQGSEGLVINGTTGESPTLTVEEDRQLFEAVAAAVTVPVVAGTGSNDTAHAIAMTEMAEQCGADGILVVTPYYNRPSQEGLYRHFRAIAEASTLPMLIYDIPIRTGRKVETATLLRLARDVSNIVGVKDAAGNPGETARLISHAPAGFEVYSGDDILTLPLLAVGAVGVISVAGHWSAPEHVAMFDAWAKGDVDTARQINARLLPSFAFETGDAAPNPVPTKAMLRTLGLPVGEPRPPMGPTPDGLEDEARRIYADLVAAR
jgi:4-hydroxy-tetrahydrodipicolinate synthase